MEQEIASYCDRKRTGKVSISSAQCSCKTILGEKLAESSMRKYLLSAGSFGGRRIVCKAGLEPIQSLSPQHDGSFCEILGWKAAHSAGGRSRGLSG